MSNDFDPSEPDSKALQRYQIYADQQLEKAKSGDIYAIDECLRIFGERLNRLYSESISRELWSTLNEFAKTDSRALYLLGIRNLYGHPFGRAEAKGVSQVLLAAERGNRSAQFDVALWRLNGMCGLTKDLAMAKLALSELAAGGMNDAQELLSVIEHQERRGGRALSEKNRLAAEEEG